MLNVDFKYCYIKLNYGEIKIMTYLEEDMSRQRGGNTTVTVSKVEICNI